MLQLRSGAVALVALVSAAALLASGCWSAAAPAGSRPPGDTEKLLANTYEQLGGSAVERDAGAYLAYQAAQTSMRECVRAAGHTYTVYAFVRRWAGWQPGAVAAGSTWVASLRPGSITGSARVAARFDRANEALGRWPTAYTRLPAAQRAVYDRDTGHCNSADAEAEALAQPANSYGLATPLRDLITDVDAQVSARVGTDSYRACMRASRIDAATHAELHDLIRASLPPPSRIPEPGTPATREWQATLDEEERLETVDAACRRTGNNLAMQLLAPRLAQFRQQHAARLAELDGQWSDLLRRADAAGFQAVIDNSGPRALPE